jgi:hypothetical protein
LGISTTDPVGLAVGLDDGPPEPVVDVPDGVVDEGVELDVDGPGGDVDDGGSSPPVHPPTASVATATPHTAYRIR